MITLGLPDLIQARRQKEIQDALDTIGALENYESALEEPEAELQFVVNHDLDDLDLDQRGNPLIYLVPTPEAVIRARDAHQRQQPIRKEAAREARKNDPRLKPLVDIDAKRRTPEGRPVYNASERHRYAAEIAAEEGREVRDYRHSSEPDPEERRRAQRRDSAKRCRVSMTDEQRRKDADRKARARAAAKAL